MLAKKRLAIMDYDGANHRYLTDSNAIVFGTTFFHLMQKRLFTQATKQECRRCFLMNVDTLKRRSLDEQPGMTFAPRFSPNGRQVVLSLTEGGNTDLYLLDIASGSKNTPYKRCIY